MQLNVIVSILRATTRLKTMHAAKLNSLQAKTPLKTNGKDSNKTALIESLDLKTS